MEFYRRNNYLKRIKSFYYEIKNMYPKYLFTSDVLLQNRDGGIHVNTADFIYNNKEL